MVARSRAQACHRRGFSGAGLALRMLSRAPLSRTINGANAGVRADQHVPAADLLQQGWGFLHSRSSRVQDACFLPHT